MESLTGVPLRDLAAQDITSWIPEAVGFFQIHSLQSFTPAIPGYGSSRR
jgi:hypothetical protein